ncbi:hypothetical protein CC86DRAFT_181506 [Ophiobolus disseminans]|uniref:Uncharacterized protein n=1 Tax=Ophiobolus disseminans TaxID=1469910 RepID=A0A6A7ABW7_9PLEO|nr:hypothetical protein CC86DRAFT_181506 [Ophiobolus disseminans]
MTSYVRNPSNDLVLRYVCEVILAPTSGSVLPWKCAFCAALSPLTRQSYASCIRSFVSSKTTDQESLYACESAYSNSLLLWILSTAHTMIRPITYKRRNSATNAQQCLARCSTSTPWLCAPSRCGKPRTSSLTSNRLLQGAGVIEHSHTFSYSLSLTCSHLIPECFFNFTIVALWNLDP